MRVIAWIADDAPGPREPRGKRAVYASVRGMQIQQKLAWLTARVLVEDPLETDVLDVAVNSLAGAGGR